MKKGFFIILILVVYMHGCEKDNKSQDEFPSPPVGLSHWPVSGITGPATATVNQMLTLEITYPTSSGCDYISEFQTVFSTNIVLVKAFGSSFDDTPCTQAAIPKKIKFNYIPTTQGAYIFKFINPDNSIIIYNLSVF
ncbi:MAG: hypothetical protein ACM3RX_04455 [Methanococcaceae archaeon]